MSGALLLMAVGGPGLASEAYTLTVGDTGVDTGYGFQPPSQGALSPSTTFRGIEIVRLKNFPDTPTRDIELILADGPHPQNFFHTLIIEDGTGTPREYTSASATFNSSETWTWGNGSNPVYTAGDVSETHSVTLTYFP